MKYVVILGDGMADDPIKELGGLTPLEKAYKPTIDKLSEFSLMGMVKTVPENMSPGSDVANLAVMGYNPLECYTGRSPLEAAGMDVVLDEDDYSLRMNLVTLSDDENFEDKTIIDYCAGDIDNEEAAQIVEIVRNNLTKDDVKFYTGVSYRHLLLLKDYNLEMASFTPPHDITGKKITEFLPKGVNKDFFIDMMKKGYDLLKDCEVNKIELLEAKTQLMQYGFGEQEQSQH